MIGGNISGLKKEVVEGVDKIRKLREDQAAVGQNIQAIRENLQSKGVAKEAVDWTIRYMGWDEDKRKQFDLAFVIVREALGVPLQSDLFD